MSDDESGAGRGSDRIAGKAVASADDGVRTDGGGTGSEGTGSGGTDSGSTAGESGGGSSRRDRLERHESGGPRNSLWSWPRIKSPLVVMRNYVVIALARICPSLRLKNWLLGRLGVTVGTGVAWGLESTPDVFWPERITVRDDVIIGYDATLLCHEFLQDEYRLGDVVLEERAMVGAGAVVLPGVTVGEGAQVAANSLVAEDVPPGTTVAGVPAEVVSEAPSVGGGDEAVDEAEGEKS